ncbi:MAG: hypothetical protein ABEJ31_09255 [Haloarculaceae archaeon]
MVPASLWLGLLVPLQESGGGELASWQIAVVAFAFVAWILLVAAVLERWEGRLHA